MARGEGLSGTKKRRQPGGILVYCQGCGRRGVANLLLLPPRTRSIPHCAECRPDSFRKTRTLESR